MNNILPLFSLDKESEIEGCKGVIYRASVSNYYKDGNIGFNTKLRKLKRKSCKGCGNCGWLEDDLQEFLYNEGGLIGVDKLEQGKLYTVIVVNESRDYESGHVDDYDLEFKEVKE